MEKKRSQWIDITKGLAILGVIIVHFPKEITWGIGYITFHVNVFFVIAGILIYEKGIANFRYLKEVKKYITIYYKLSLFYIMFWGIINYLNNPSKISDFIMLQLYKTFTLLGIGTLWFLPTFLLGKLIFITLLKYIKKDYIFLVELALTIGTSWMCYYLYKNGIIGFVHFNPNEMEISLVGIILDLISVVLQGIIASGFFCLGYFLYYLFENMIEIREKKNTAVILGGIYLFIINYYCSCFFHSDLHLLKIRYPIGFLIASSCGCMCVMLISMSLSRIPCLSRVIGFIGKNSLIIMTTHLEYNIIKLSYRFIMLLHINSNNAILLNIQIIIVVVLCEIIIIKLVKYTPLKWFFNFK